MVGRRRTMDMSFVDRTPAVIAPQSEQKQLSALFVPLTQGKVAIVDGDQFEIAAMGWHVSGGGRRGEHFYAIRFSSYRPNVRQIMHRLISGAIDGEDVDHINGDTLDNRRINLRKVTKAQNAQNRRGAQSNSETRVRGVHWDKDHQRYRARVRANGVTVFQRDYRSLAEADAAVREARARLMTHSSECQEEIPTRELGPVGRLTLVALCGSESGRDSIDVGDGQGRAGSRRFGEYPTVELTAVESPRALLSTAENSETPIRR